MSMVDSESRTNDNYNNNNNSFLKTTSPPLLLKIFDYTIGSPTVSLVRGV